MSPSRAKQPKSFDPDDYRMSFGDHLDELRKRMIRGLLGVGVIAIGTFYYGTDIVAWLTLPLTQAQHRLNLPEGTINTSILEPFAVFMKVAIISALVLGAPWLLYQMWKFVETGLYASERKVVVILAPFSTIMVVLGVMFMYYILLPISVGFLLYFSQGYPDTGGERASFLDLIEAVSPFQNAEDQPSDAPDGDAAATPQPVNQATVNQFGIAVFERDPAEPRDGQIWINAKSGNLKVFFNGKSRIVTKLGERSLMTPMIDINQYIGFVMFMGLGIVVGFQLPVAMLIGGWTGIVPPRLIAKYRKHAIFLCAVLGALLTPADPVSMGILAVPLYVLFEFGLLLMRMSYKPRGLLWDQAPQEDEGEKK